MNEKYYTVQYYDMPKSFPKRKCHPILWHGSWRSEQVNQKELDRILKFLHWESYGEYKMDSKNTPVYKGSLFGPSDYRTDGKYNKGDE